MDILSIFVFILQRLENLGGASNFTLCQTQNDQFQSSEESMDGTFVFFSFRGFMILILDW